MQSLQVKYYVEYTTIKIYTIQSRRISYNQGEYPTKWILYKYKKEYLEYPTSKVKIRESVPMWQKD